MSNICNKCAKLNKYTTCTNNDDGNNNLLKLLRNKKHRLCRKAQITTLLNNKNLTKIMNIVIMETEINDIIELLLLYHPYLSYVCISNIDYILSTDKIINCLDVNKLLGIYITNIYVNINTIIACMDKYQDRINLEHLYHKFIKCRTCMHYRYLPLHKYFIANKVNYLPYLNLHVNNSVKAFLSNRSCYCTRDYHDYFTNEHIDILTSVGLIEKNNAVDEMIENIYYLNIFEELVSKEENIHESVLYTLVKQRNFADIWYLQRYNIIKNKLTITYNILYNIIVYTYMGNSKCCESIKLLNKCDVSSYKCFKELFKNCVIIDERHEVIQMILNDYIPDEFNIRDMYVEHLKILECTEQELNLDKNVKLNRYAKYLSEQNDDYVSLATYYCHALCNLLHVNCLKNINIKMFENTHIKDLLLFGIVENTYYTSMYTEIFGEQHDDVVYNLKNFLDYVLCM